MIEAGFFLLKISLLFCTLKTKSIFMRKFSLLALISILFVCGCSKDEVIDPAEQLQKEIALIEAYLAKHNLTATKTASGIHYIITKEGTGDYPTATSEVTVKYKGYLLDGTVFDQTTGTDTAKFKLNGVIPGWREAVPLLKKGGKGTFFIPSSLAYGALGTQDGTIKPNTVLIFDIELIDFTN